MTQQALQNALSLVKQDIVTMLNTYHLQEVLALMFNPENYEDFDEEDYTRWVWDYMKRNKNDNIRRN